MLDLITIGRAAVDLYGEQIGSPLEDIATFKKSLGGCPANVAVGAARQGLRVGIITRVGDEAMGRFVRATLAAEGVDVSGVKTDASRLTGLVLLSIRDSETFPLIFYRERCADMGLVPEDIEPELIARARAVLVTGTHFSSVTTDAACRRAITLARERGARVVLDIDYRPVLWGLTGHGGGELRFIASETVTAHLASLLEHVDLVVGTREEIHIAGGSTDDLLALRAIRARTNAVIVMKRGALGAVVFDGAIPTSVEAGILAPPVPIEVLNVLGAGDAFLAGFLRGWLEGAPLHRCAAYGNVSGALVVSRHGCAPAMPSRQEVDEHLASTSGVRVDLDPRIRALHRAQIRRWPKTELCVLAFDHRTSLERVAERVGASPDRLPVLKRLIARAARETAERLGLAPFRAGETTAGMIIDRRFGREALFDVTGLGFWIARPIERPVPLGAPLELEGEPNVELELATWPREHVVKCLAHYHPRAPDPERRATLAALVRLSGAVIGLERELLLEIVPVHEGVVEAEVIPDVLETFYQAGVRPDAWKLPPPARAETWARIDAIIDAHDPESEGVLLLGLDAPEVDLADAFRVARGARRARGFAVGRTIFGEPAEAWLGGGITDQALVDAVGEAFARMIGLWSSRRDTAAYDAEGGR